MIADLPTPDPTTFLIGIEGGCLTFSMTFVACDNTDQAQIWTDPPVVNPPISDAELWAMLEDPRVGPMIEIAPNGRNVLKMPDIARGVQTGQTVYRVIAVGSVVVLTGYLIFANQDGIGGQALSVGKIFPLIFDKTDTKLSPMRATKATTKTREQDCKAMLGRLASGIIENPMDDSFNKLFATLGLQLTSPNDKSLAWGYYCWKKLLFRGGSMAKS